mmetsp:Transcript_27491/g.50825  ORF Transcript_27491/g.50825 Transcript_27491/m.50825 type:complete len:305 (+) Transcript_27491:1833-2747(+)
MVSPSAAKPARINDTEARKSVAITRAPLSFSTPCTVAVPPCTSILAPMRISSGACIKRFSKIFSSRTDVPSAVHIIAMNCACRSVGKPGNGSVVTSTAFTRPFLRATLRPFSVSSTSIPASCSLVTKLSTRSRRPPRSSTSPPQKAGANIKVPSSIRSVTTGWVAPCKRSTPCTVISEVPSPSICAPMERRQVAKSTISGSRAAFLITVVPLANVAAIRMFSVAPTEAKASSITAPLRPFGALACRYPSFSSISAPSFSRPKMCKSIGRAPIAQPPGKDTTACPRRASIGPSTRLDARIFRTIS